MPDIGWMELLVIGVVALIVVGPKDLPMMFRKLGQFTGRVRGMAKDFQRAMDEAADESGMTELNRDLRKAAQYTTNPKKAGMNALKETIGDLGIDPADYPEGSETRKMAEQKVQATAKMREEVEARRQAKIDQTIADKEAAAAARTAPAAEPTAPADAAPETPRPDIEADLPPARTGTQQS